MRLVDADDAVNRFEELKPKGSSLDVRYAYGVSVGLEMAKHVIMSELPTVDAAPVRHEQWIREDYWSEGVGMGESYGYYYKCPKCGNLVRGGYNECGKKYCDECGARMDGKEVDNGQTD